MENYGGMVGNYGNAIPSPEVVCLKRSCVCKSDIVLYYDYHLFFFPEFSIPPDLEVEFFDPFLLIWVSFVFPSLLFLLSLVILVFVFFSSYLTFER